MGIACEHISREIHDITEWVVFEPNDESTWSRVRETVSNYLYQLWRNGDLVGATASEAYFVKCDSKTDTIDDRLTILVGIARKKPTEFEILTLTLTFREIV